MAHYRVSTDRKAEHPARNLKGFNGFMHADGYAGLKDLFRADEISEVACMALAVAGGRFDRWRNHRQLLGPMADNGSFRRKFVDVHESEGSAIAEGEEDQMTVRGTVIPTNMRRIAGLCAIEKKARGSPPDARVRL